MSIITSNKFPTIQDHFFIKKNKYIAGKQSVTARVCKTRSSMWVKHEKRGGGHWGFRVNEGLWGKGGIWGRSRKCSVWTLMFLTGDVNEILCIINSLIKTLGVPIYNWLKVLSFNIFVSFSFCILMLKITAPNYKYQCK